MFPHRENCKQGEKSAVGTGAAVIAFSHVPDAAENKQPFGLFSRLESQKNGRFNGKHQQRRKQFQSEMFFYFLADDCLLPNVYNRRLTETVANTSEMIIRKHE